jgi:hypothetical protein
MIVSLQLYKCFDEFTKSKSDDKMTLYRIATGQKNKDQYGTIFFYRKNHER